MRRRFVRALEGSQRSQAKVSPVYSAPLCWFERSQASSVDDRQKGRNGGRTKKRDIGRGVMGGSEEGA